MKTVLGIFIFIVSYSSFATTPDSSSIQLDLPIEKKEAYKAFSIGADWLLETKAEIINGVSYSPTLEFNITRPNGFNFQIQTGALPIFTGLRINKTQPAAGFSFSYNF